MNLIPFFTDLILCATCCFLSAQDEPAAAETQTYWNRRSAMEQKFALAVNHVIADSPSSDSKAVAAALGQFVVRRDPQRQYIFIPPEDVAGLDRMLAELPDDVKQQAVQILAAHADDLYQLAAERAEQGEGATAFQLLHEVLYFAPDHEAARKILGHRIVGENGERRWRIKSDRLRIRKATRPHAHPAWPTGSYTIVSTPNFRIASRASESETEFLAEQLERWHDIWRQVFFEYYQRSANIRGWFSGKGHYRQPDRKFEVVFFADKNDYVAGLAADVPGIEASTGYYHDGQQTSYFYASDDATVLDTWRHELTHQLFQETRRSERSPFRDQFLWLGEGIAMYFESVTDFGSYATLGGFDARRLQYARLRRLNEQFQIPLTQLSQLNRVEFQSQDQVARAYSQSAGLTHYLMTGDDGSMQKSLIEFLQLSYQGRLKPDSFEKMIGKSNEEIDAAYVQFLQIQPGQLDLLSKPATRTELALTSAPLQDHSLRPVGKCSELRWLDLSGCDVTGDRLSPLTNCRQLEQLFLAGCRVDRDTIRNIVQLPIRELDLSGSGITDTELALLAESGFLRSLDVSRTAITSGGIEAFKSRRPGVEITAN